MARLVLFFFFLWLLTLSSCNWSGSRTDIDLSGTPVTDIRVHRYDQALFRITPDQICTGLEKIKPEFRFFLDTDLCDSNKVRDLSEYLRNVRTIEFYNACQTEFPDLTNLEKELTEAFHHYSWYYPDSRIPRIYTYISGGDYEYPVRFIDSVILIALDTYLGVDYQPYQADGVPLYKINRMSAEYILPGCFREIVRASYPVTYPGNNLLAHIVESGKRIYFVDAMMPGYPDFTKIDYTPEQMDWVRKHESQVWATIIEHRMLFSSSSQVIRSLMADGPFTAEFSQESPPRLGEYIGWQIIRNYMENNTMVSLPELMQNVDYQKILSESGYKPKK